MFHGIRERRELMAILILDFQVANITLEKIMLAGLAVFK
jgi:hypothetical protein